MKIRILLLSSTIVLLTFFNVFSQVKHDNIWLFGRPPNLPEQLFGGTKIEFTKAGLELQYFDILIDLGEHTIISDLKGQLKYYSNGCQVIGLDHQIVLNGDSINQGSIHDSYCSNAYPHYQGITLIPGIENSEYFLFYVRLVRPTIRNEDFLIGKIAEDSIARVAYFDSLVYKDDFVDQLTCARHANGRDWWIMIPKKASNGYFSFLFNGDHITDTLYQEVGVPWVDQDWSGQATFSPDGSKYFRANPHNGLHIFDFDRCTGTLSNPIHITFPNDTIFSSGVAVSPNNRFLYLSASLRIYQFDLWASNIEESKMEVAYYDGFESPFSTTFFHQMLGPDGKIYITAPNGVNVLHVIHAPNEKGMACQVEQHGVHMPSHHSFTMPNFPHFRLGPMDGSPCDTLSINNEPIAEFRYEIDSIDKSEFRFYDLSYFEPDSWLWDFGDGTQSDSRRPIHRYAEEGNYEVCLNVSNEYGSHTECTEVEVDPMVSNNEEAKSEDIFLYPNPAGDYFVLKENSGVNNRYFVRIYNMQGRLVYSERCIAGEKVTIELTPGLYFYKITSENGIMYAGKLVKG